MNHDSSDNDTDLVSDSLVLVEALYAIAHESEEAETVRLAIAALTNTASGMSYLRTHPINT